MLHFIFQRQGITPSEFYKHSPGDQAFMLASTRVWYESRQNNPGSAIEEMIEE